MRRRQPPSPPPPYARARPACLLALGPPGLRQLRDQLHHAAAWPSPSPAGVAQRAAAPRALALALCRAVSRGPATRGPGRLCFFPGGVAEFEPSSVQSSKNRARKNRGGSSAGASAGGGAGGGAVRCVCVWWGGWGGVGWGVRERAEGAPGSRREGPRGGAAGAAAERSDVPQGGLGDGGCWGGRSGRRGGTHAHARPLG